MRYGLIKRKIMLPALMLTIALAPSTAFADQKGGIKSEPTPKVESSIKAFVKLLEFQMDVVRDEIANARAMSKKLAVVGQLKQAAIWAQTHDNLQDLLQDMQDQHRKLTQQQQVASQVSQAFAAKKSKVDKEDKASKKASKKGSSKGQASAKKAMIKKLQVRYAQLKAAVDAATKTYAKELARKSPDEATLKALSKAIDALEAALAQIRSQLASV